MEIKVFLGATAMAFACHAGANTTDWDKHSPLELAINTVPVGLFTDTIDFTLHDNRPLNVTTVSNNLFPVLGISDGLVQLFEKAQGSSPILIDGYAFNGITGDTSHVFSPSGAGDYFYQITGKGTGSNGGLYTLTSAPAPVPEPSGWVMSLCGTLLIGAIASRRGTA